MSSPHSPPESEGRETTYNVYGEPINPLNQVPLAVNQLPHPDQRASLSTEREASTIPKASDQTWLYPSPQMFYNALKRKGKGEDVDEEIVAEIVRIHNNMNEKTWHQVLQWEALHASDCKEERRLVRFMGRPHDLSPRAWLAHHVLGKDKPFDRHDWFVSRCGREVRYVIDYYHDEARGKDDRTPAHKRDFSAMKSISVFTRPALDSPTALLDRARMVAVLDLGLWSVPGVDKTAFRSSFEGDVAAAQTLSAVAASSSTPAMSASASASGRPASASAPVAVAGDVEIPPECPVSSKHVKPAAKPAAPPPPPAEPRLDLASLDRAKLTEVTGKIQTKCRAAFEALQSCTNVGATEAETALHCERASLALFHCIATVTCPEEAAAYQVKPSHEPALDEMVACVKRFEGRAAEVRRG